METLLIVAIVVTTLAVLAQAGALLAMYVMAKRVTDNVNGLVNESHKLMAPLERISANLEKASSDFTIIAGDAKEEMQRARFTLGETNEALREEIADLRLRVRETADEVQDLVMTPVREWSALASGVQAGLKTFFGRKRQLPATIDEDIDIRHRPAA